MACQARVTPEPRRQYRPLRSSPALPPGPGYGNGTGGANGVRGTVASSGFGNGVAVAPSAPERSCPRRYRPAASRRRRVDTAAPKPKQADNPAAITEVIILEKPKPQYSEEARKLGLEGDVLVDVIFPASGPVQVLRVTKGLGHGLDEAAIRAAQQIRFKPAMQNGKQPGGFSGDGSYRIPDRVLKSFGGKMKVSKLLLGFLGLVRSAAGRADQPDAADQPEFAGSGRR